MENIRHAFNLGFLLPILMVAVVIVYGVLAIHDQPEAVQEKNRVLSVVLPLISLAGLYAAFAEAAWIGVATYIGAFVMASVSTALAVIVFFLAFMTACIYWSELMSRYRGPELPSEWEGS